MKTLLIVGLVNSVLGLLASLAAIALLIWKVAA
jgi:hypothetical protein